jgi:hypothetical protein
VLLTPAFKIYFSIAKEQVLLTPDMTNMAISRKAAKDLLFLQHAKTAKNRISKKAKKSGWL